MFEIIKAAGWPIWPLLLVSVIGLALVIERFVTLRTERIMPSALYEKVLAVYRGGKVNKNVVETLEQDSPLGYVLAAGLRHTGTNRAMMKEAMEDAGVVVAHQLERFLMALGTIASLSPLMGLFGTVVGMIEIFASQNAMGTDPTQLARGISIALYNTGFGLAIAIPALVFYKYFRARVEGMLVGMEQLASRLVNDVHGSQG